MEELKIGDYIYIINEYGKKHLRKVTWINQYFFEWNSGWESIDELKSNPDNKSKVKYILYESF